MIMMSNGSRILGKTMHLINTKRWSWSNWKQDGEKRWLMLYLKLFYLTINSLQIKNISIRIEKLF